MLRRALELSDAYLQEQAGKLANGPPFLPVQWLTSGCSAGQAAGAILQFAEDNSIDLILTSTHGESGIDLTLEDYMDHMVTGRSAYAAHLGEADRDAFRERRNRRYEMSLQTEDIQIPGVENALAELATDYPMAIVTTSRRSHFELIHESRRIVRYFDFVLAHGDYARSKPAPDPYLAAVERFGIEPEQALIIEDSARGLGSALAAGIPCVIVDNEFTRGQDFSGAAARIESLGELPGLLA